MSYQYHYTVITVILLVLNCNFLLTMLWLFYFVQGYQLHWSHLLSMAVTCCNKDWRQHKFTVSINYNAGAFLKVTISTSCARNFKITNIRCHNLDLWLVYNYVVYISLVSIMCHSFIVILLLGDVSKPKDDLSLGATTDRAADHLFFVELLKGLGITLGNCLFCKNKWP